MRLKDSAIGNLARMICGDEPFTYFPYRSSSYLTTFFEGINLDYVHDGSTRYWWVREVLVQLNNIGDEHSKYLSEEIVSVIEHLLDSNQFMFEQKTDYDKAIESVSKVLKQQKISIDESGQLKYLSGVCVSEIEQSIQVNLSEGKVEMNRDNSLSKIFISHSTKDSDYVLPIIELLEALGIKDKQIFCTSFEGYGIPFGENFLERIKAELNENILVLFIFSPNFFNSPVSLCEMGATWVRSSAHIPILIPPFDFSEVKGVLPHTQGFKINVPEKLNTFKKQVLTFFNLEELDSTIWERKRKRFLDEVNDIIGNFTRMSVKIEEPRIEEIETKSSLLKDIKIIQDISSIFTCDKVFKFLNDLQERKTYSLAQLIELEQTITRYNATDKKLRSPELQRAKVEFFESITNLATFGKKIFFEVNNGLDMKFYGGDVGSHLMKNYYDNYEKQSNILSSILKDVNEKWDQFFELTQLTFAELEFEWA